MNRARLLSILILLPTVGLINAQQTFSLDEAIAYAMQHNNQVKLERLNVADAEGQVLEYKSIGIPKLSVDVDYSYHFDVPTVIFPDFITPAVYNVLFEEEVIAPKPIPTTGSAPVKLGKNNSFDAGLTLARPLRCIP